MKIDSLVAQVRRKYALARSGKSQGARKSRKRHRVGGRHSTFELLEMRRLLAAEVTLAANTLVVTDQTDSNDQFSIETSGANYVISNNSPLTVVGLADSDSDPNSVTVAKSLIDGIVVNASGGDDTIQLGNVGDTSIEIDGGDGDDMFTFNVDGAHNLELSHVTGTSGAGATYRLSSLDSPGTFEQTNFIVNASVTAVTINLGTGDDTFEIGDMGADASVLSKFTINADDTAATGGDTIKGPNVASTWNISGANTGSVNGATISGFDTIVGGDAGNEINVTPGSGTPAIAIQGDSGQDNLIVAASGNVVTSGSGSVTVGGFAPISFNASINSITATDWRFSAADQTKLMDGLTELASFGDALESTGRFNTSIPLAGNGGADGDTPLTFGDLSDPGGVLLSVKDDLQSSSFGTTALASDLISFLTGPSLGATVSTQLNISQSGVQSLQIDTQFDAARTNTINLANQERLKQQGLFFADDATFDVTATTAFDFSFGIDEDAFFIDFEGNQFDVAVAESAVLLDGKQLGIGVLGTTIDGGATLDLAADLQISIENSGANGTRLSVDELQNNAAENLASVTGDGTIDANFDVTPVVQTGFVAGVVAANVQIGGMTIGGDTLDVFRDLPSGPPVFMTSDLVPYTRVTAQDLLDPLDPLVTWLDGVVATGMFDVNVPLVDIQLGEVLDFSGALQRGLIEQVSEQSRVTALAAPTT